MQVVSEVWNKEVLLITQNRFYLIAGKDCYVKAIFYQYLACEENYSRIIIEQICALSQSCILHYLDNLHSSLNDYNDKLSLYRSISFRLSNTFLKLFSDGMPKATAVKTKNSVFKLTQEADR